MTSPSGDGSGAQPLIIDTSKPHPARMYDYFLGGKDNYPVDRDAAEQFIKAAPEVREGVRANRSFMHRAVRHVVEEGGVRQIIDIGTGLPTEPNVHQIAHAVAPDTRIVYVDNDPIVSTHSMALMEDSDTSVILADLRDPRSILDHPEVREAIDFDRPVAVLLVAVVHFLSDEGDDPYGIVATLRDALPAGSYLVLSHATGDVHEDGRHDAASVYNRATATLNLRSHAQVLDFFGDFTLVDPGLVRVTHWRPEETPAPGAAPIGIYGGVARKDA